MVDSNPAKPQRTSSNALEAFEGEHTNNWAVLGRNLTVNFFGVCLYIIARISVGQTSMPWQSMIAPAIQSIVLLYVLARVSGIVGRVRMSLVLERCCGYDGIRCAHGSRPAE